MAEVRLVPRDHGLGSRQPAGLIENRVFEVRKLALQSFLDHDPVDRGDLKELKQFPQGLAGGRGRHGLRKQVVKRRHGCGAQEPRDRRLVRLVNPVFRGRAGAYHF